jgi:hypothetical protein
MLAEQKETTAVFKDSVLDVEYPPDQEAGVILTNYPGATGLEARQPDGSNVGFRFIGTAKVPAGDFNLVVPAPAPGNQFLLILPTSSFRLDLPEILDQTPRPQLTGRLWACAFE